MKLRIYIIIAALALAAQAFGQTNANSFQSALVQQLMSDPDVDKNVLINRDPDNRSNIESASYNFKFSSPDRFNKIRAELLRCSRTADFFRRTTGKNEAILMRVSSPDGTTSSYKLQRLGRRNFSFLINVNPTQSLNNTVEIATESARQSARTAREQARQQTLRAQQQARQAREQARQAQQQARAAQQQARRAQQQAREHSGGNVVVSKPVTAQKQAEIRELRQQLDKERAERERELH